MDGRVRVVTQQARQAGAEPLAALPALLAAEAARALALTPPLPPAAWCAPRAARPSWRREPACAAPARPAPRSSPALRSTAPSVSAAADACTAEQLLSCTQALVLPATPTAMPALASIPLPPAPSGAGGAGSFTDGPGHFGACDMCPPGSAVADAGNAICGEQQNGWWERCWACCAVRASPVRLRHPTADRRPCPCPPALPPADTCPPGTYQDQPGQLRCIDW